MKKVTYCLLMLLALLLGSCSPNYNYTVAAPLDWTVKNIFSQGMRVRIIQPPASLAGDNVYINIIIEPIGGENIDAFTRNNMDYLKKHGDNITLLEQGDMDVSAISARWFTYTKVHDGVPRDLINYIIPSHGFAYMITCGTREGRMGKYRQTFDRIARSFKG